jgi:hypothetical protein
MPQLIALSRRWLASPLMAALILSLTSACATTTPAPTTPILSGHWQLDKAASDLVDTKVSAAIADTEAQLRKHAGQSGYGNGGTYGGSSGRRGGGGRGGGGTAGGGQGGTGDGTDSSGEDFDAFRQLGPDFVEIRRRLMGVLTPPVHLQFDTGTDLVRITPDSVPPFDYHADEEFSRIDEYGTAKIDAGWSGNAFVLRARYSSHATLVEHYKVDARTDTLTVTCHLRDPMVGKIDVSSVYHRG